MVRLDVLLATAFIFIPGDAAQSIPFLELLNSESMLQLAQVAAQLGQQTAQGAARNEREIMLRKEAPQVKEIDVNARPSEILGQAFTNLARPLKMQTLNNIEHPESFLHPPADKRVKPIAPAYSSIDEAAAVQQAAPQRAQPSGNIWTEMIRAFGGSALSGITPAPAPPRESERGHGEIEIRRERMHGLTQYGGLGAPVKPVVASPVEGAAAQVAAASASAAKAVEPLAPAPPSPFMQLANAFLKGGSSLSQPSPVRTEGVPVRQAVAPPPLPSMKEVVPGANANFGIPKGKGCLPFLSEFMQIAYGNCVKEADEAAYESWTQELQSAVFSGKMDVLKASRESCKRGAEREQCNQLRQAIAECDIMGSLQITASLQRNLKRCEEISGVIDQNPITVMNQIGHLFNGEITHGFLNNFLG